MEVKQPMEMDHRDRLNEFDQTFDLDKDPFITIYELIQATGDFLEMIVGTKNVNEGMPKILGLQSKTERANWRAELEESEAGMHCKLELVEDLFVVAAYGSYGIDHAAREHDSEEEVASRISSAIKRAETLVAFCPLDLWVGKDGHRSLEDALMLAKNRWALDHGLPVEPEALAMFGDITMGSMRNLLSGKTAIFKKINGKIGAKEALDWLSEKRSFFPSIWRHARPEWDGQSYETDYLTPVFVPQSRDGSIFHPGLRRNGTFTVGEKGSEKQIVDYEEALAALQEMPRTAWRRPGRGKGGWGTVSAVHWVRMSHSELDHHARIEIDLDHPDNNGLV